MLQIRIIAIGKVREPYLQEGSAVYLRRLRPYAQVDEAEVPGEPIPGKLSLSEKALLLDREAGRLLAAAKPGGVSVVLDASGEPWSSEDLASRLSRWELSAAGPVQFFIGGPLGLSPRVIHSAQCTVSLSRMTFPHQMVRMILLEQLYRAARLSRGEPYHK